MATSIQDLRKRANLPAKQAGGETVSEFFEANKKSMLAVLPKHVGVDRMLKVALGALRTTPKLMECTTTSLFGACIQCAQLGLEPNTPFGHAYLVPFHNNRAKRTDVQVIIGYRGMLDLARRSGQIVSIAAHEVRENDKFDFAYGIEERLEHQPADGERGEVKGYYAVAKLVGGGYAFEYMSAEDVAVVMRRSQSKGAYGPWKDHRVEMGRKTVIRRLFKYLPVSIEVATAAAIDSAADGEGMTQDMSAVLEGEFSVSEDTFDAGHEDEEDAGGTEEEEEREQEQPAKTGGDAAAGDVWPKKFVDPETGEEGWTDKAGDFFDPNKHGIRSDGTPSMTPSHNFRKKRASHQVGETGGNDGEGPGETGGLNAPSHGEAAGEDDFGGME